MAKNQENARQKNIAKKEIRGITLIALVVTIIVLLLLAGISISMLAGNNGILNRAGEAKEKTEIAGTKEQVQLQVLGSYDQEANLNLNTLKLNLESVGAKVIADNFPITAILNHKSYKIDDKGNVEVQENADRTGIHIGDYINFEPDTDYDEGGNPVAKTYSKDYLAKKYTGVSYGTINTSDLVQDTLKWQVLKIYEDGSMKIIGTPTSKRIRFISDVAYNNVVWLLNDICEDLYSKKSVGITARSINLGDLEDEDYYVSETKGNWKQSKDNYIYEQISAMQEKLSKGSDYIDDVDLINNTVTYKKDYSYYPALYEYENGSGIDTKNVKTDGITENNKFIKSKEDIDVLTGNNARKQASNYLTTKYTEYENSINETNYGDIYTILLGPDRCRYWLASRSIKCSENAAEFGATFIDKTLGRMYFHMFVSSYNSSGEASASARPIVTIGPNVKIAPSDTASDIEGTPHEITSYN